MMKEDFLQYIWRTKRLTSQVLSATNGSQIEVLKPGHYNTDQGPDYLFAQLNIDDVIWVGNIEIHVNSSDWNKHQHSDDPNYKNIILHIVWNHDVDILVNDQPLLTLELKHYVLNTDLERYHLLKDSQFHIPCHAFFNQVPNHVKLNQLDKLVVERLESKTNRIKDLLATNEQDWEAVFYNYFCQYLVTPVNTDAMSRLNQLVPWNLVYKLNELELEAALFGTAGMIPDIHQSDYVTQLSNQFDHLVTKYKLKKMNSNSWLFLRLRPAHFPSLRIAQIARFFSSIQRPFAKILEFKSLNQVREFLNTTPSTYWQEHYLFDKISPSSNGHRLGKQTKDILIINVICPLLYVYGQTVLSNDLCSKALSWLEQVGAEKNKYTNDWKLMGLKADSAAQSQAMLQLSKHYCEHTKCLECQIGHYIMSNPTAVK